MSEMIEDIPHKLLMLVRETLIVNEETRILLKGAFGEVLACSDRRAMIAKKGFMTGQTWGSNVYQVTYDRIAGVEVRYNLMSGYFEINCGGMQNRNMNYWSTNPNEKPQNAPNCISLNNRAQADKFRRAAGWIMSQHGSASDQASLPTPAPSLSSTPKLDGLFAKLEGLSKLRDGGAITANDYEVKKAELLAQI